MYDRRRNSEKLKRSIKQNIQSAIDHDDEVKTVNENEKKDNTNS